MNLYKMSAALFVSMMLTTPVIAADAAAGEKAFKKCASCHSIAEGDKNKVGPNLWNVVNRGIAAVPDFKYSNQLVEFSKTNLVWTPELLNQWLENSQGLVKGTKMNIKIAKPEERDNIIAYLQSMGSN